MKDSIRSQKERFQEESGRERIEVKPASVLPDIADRAREEVWPYGLLMVIVLCVIFWMVVAWLVIW
jgi:hypothetical protein